MKKILRVVLLILIFQTIFVNISYSEEYEILRINEPVKCCDGEQIIGEKVEELTYAPIFDEIINSGISLFSSETSRLETAYSLIYDILREHPKEMIINNSISFPLSSLGLQLTQEEFQTVVCRIMYECGELFVSKRYSYNSSYDGRYINGVSFKYFVDYREIDGELAKINKMVKPFIDSVNTDKLSELEKVLLTHDYIANITRYRISTDSGTTDQFHSMHGLFTRGVCVCQGYTEAMIFLLDKLGIEAGAVVCDKINHVWNCVNVDNKWYHLDLTWDDVYSFYKKAETIEIVDSISYDSFLQGIEDVILDKEAYAEAILGTDANGEAIYGTYTYSDGDFFYPSLEIDNDDTRNYEYKSGYIFNGLEHFVVLVSDTKFEKAEPKGFFYEDGKFVKRFDTNGIVLPPVSYFEFDSLKKMDYYISRPVKATDGNYHFFSYNHSGLPQTRDGYDFYIKSTINNELSLREVSSKYRVVAGKYKITFIDDSETINEMNNSQSSELFLWDENMRPLSYKVRK